MHALEECYTFGSSGLVWVVAGLAGDEDTRRMARPDTGLCHVSLNPIPISTAATAVEWPWIDRGLTLEIVIFFAYRPTSVDQSVD